MVTSTSTAPAMTAQADTLRALDEVRRHLELHAEGDPVGAGPSSTDGSASPSRESGPEPVSPPSGPLPLGTLCRLFELTPFERDVLLLAAGPDLDATFAALCSKAQVDANLRLPTPGLALAALPGASWEALLPEAPLRYWRLITLAPGTNLVASPLGVDERILHYLLGYQSLESHLAEITDWVSPVPGGLVPSHEGLVAEIAAVWRRTRGTADFPVIQLCGPDRGSKGAIASQVARTLGLELVQISAEALPTAPQDLGLLIRLAQRESILRGAALLVDGHDLSPGDGERGALVHRFVERSRGNLILSLRQRLRPRRRVMLTFDVGKPTCSEQRDLWRRSLGEAGLDRGGVPLDKEIESLVGQFDLSAARIRTVCLGALGRLQEGEEDLGAALWHSCRLQARPQVADLVELITPRARRDELVIPQAQHETLREIVMQVRHRAKVYEDWGFGKTSARGRGVSALFAGSSGTGKTMAAEVLAQELALDLYRIDLSTVISKYIGETEKNLQQVFDAAEEGGAVLLFDEADALFGKRTEVKDSHDRYANVEVSYLLQRMESYRGLAILTTNMKDSLDLAFLRRLRFIVEFPFPDKAQRREIWRRVFPPGTPTSNLKIERLAALNVTGGNIRNIVLNAAFLAANAGRPVGMPELLKATRREFHKLGKPLPDHELRGWMV